MSLKRRRLLCEILAVRPRIYVFLVLVLQLLLLCIVAPLRLLREEYEMGSLRPSPLSSGDDDKKGGLLLNHNRRFLQDCIRPREIPRYSKH